MTFLKTTPIVLEKTSQDHLVPADQSIVPIEEDEGINRIRTRSLARGATRRALGGAVTMFFENRRRTTTSTKAVAKIQ